jgi:dienelactone hydrolase
MGLFKSMRRVDTRVPLNQQALFPGTASTVHFGASQDGQTVATATLTRRTLGRGVTEYKTTLGRDGFISCYYAPARAARRSTAVVFIGGSSGGLPCGYVPSLLASHGYPAMALAYFNAPGLPKNLERIPLEYFKRALQWLAKQPGVDPVHLVPLGLLRGAEAALLLGTVYPSLVHGVAWYLGGDIVGISPHASDIPAWTLRGKPLATGMVIPAWKINGPIFFVGATGDSSSGSVEDAVTHLRAHHRHDYTALIYNGAGHALGSMVPNLPYGNTYLRFGVPTSLGGTLAADSAARSDSWPKLLAFLGRLRVR